MISKRQLAAVIWIAIVTIAVALLPATAFAHGGHGHLRGSVAAATHDRAEDGALQLSKHTAAVAQAKAAEISRAAISGICHDGCCANGFSCCAPAILPELLLRLPVCLKARKAEQLAAPIRAGIDPEALPEPPKSFT